MSLHFIIDGYNLIKQTNLLKRANLEDSRAALIRFLTIERPQGSRNNKITVVFDGKEGDFCHRPVSYIQVIFAQKQSADDKIKRLVEKSPNPKNVVVVTNDKEIRFFVRQLGAEVKTTEEFLLKSQQQKAKAKIDDKIDLSPSESARITEEMKKLWLGE